MFGEVYCRVTFLWVACSNLIGGLLLREAGNLPDLQWVALAECDIEPLVIPNVAFGRYDLPKSRSLYRLQPVLIVERSFHPPSLEAIRRMARERESRRQTAG